MRLGTPSPSLEPSLAHGENQCQRLLGASCVAGSPRQALTCTISCAGWKGGKRSTLMVAPRSGAYYPPHVTGEAPEGHRGEVTSKATEFVKGTKN